MLLSQTAIQSAGREKNARSTIMVSFTIMGTSIFIAMNVREDKPQILFPSVLYSKLAVTKETMTLHTMHVCIFCHSLYTRVIKISSCL